ncbi:hypothetical protein BOTNAR_0135g00010 [Botryotinia narcissicola]|uniref:Uncharacterized protein n=1 Tax=Botryotinia narcissicola TaxID=278944 RepID=A0A4Z1IKI1_9HELO|nr:hypothetical protein BOTNAR_0135g00010 [Botryotinia narcissicola]
MLVPRILNAVNSPSTSSQPQGTALAIASQTTIFADLEVHKEATKTYRRAIFGSKVRRWFSWLHSIPQVSPHESHQAMLFGRKLTNSHSSIRADMLPIIIFNVFRICYIRKQLSCCGAVPAGTLRRTSDRINVGGSPGSAGPHQAILPGLHEPLRVHGFLRLAFHSFSAYKPQQEGKDIVSCISPERMAGGEITVGETVLGCSHTTDLF